MKAFIWECPHLLLNRRAITGTNAKVPIVVAELRSLMIVSHDHFVGASICVRDVAGDLVLLQLIAIEFVQEAEPLDLLIALISLHLRVVDSLAAEAWRSSCP